MFIDYGFFPTTSPSLLVCIWIVTCFLETVVVAFKNVDKLVQAMVILRSCQDVPFIRRLAHLRSGQLKFDMFYLVFISLPCFPPHQLPVLEVDRPRDIIERRTAHSQQLTLARNARLAKFWFDHLFSMLLAQEPSFRAKKSFSTFSWPICR